MGVASREGISIHQAHLEPKRNTMNKMSLANFSLSVAVIALLMLATIVAIIQQPMRTSGSTISQGPALQVATTSTSFSVTTSVRVLATTTTTGVPSYTRIYATICNPNANPVYLNMDGDKAASSGKATAVIAAAAGYNVCFEVNDRNPYNGSIQASSTNQTATTISVEDFVY